MRLFGPKRDEITRGWRKTTNLLQATNYRCEIYGTKYLLSGGTDTPKSDSTLAFNAALFGEHGRWGGEL